jgi:ABC-type polysaccharide/polyol phosphate export permease
LSTNTPSAKTPWRTIPGVLGNLYERRWLIGYFVQRELTKSYRTSFLGLAWLVLGPLLMVVLYTLVFSEIIGLRFKESDSVANFGLYLYCGLIPFLAYADTMNKSVTSIRSNSNLVTRVVFPLEILPTSTALTAWVTQFFGLGALMILVVLLEHQVKWTLILLPIVAIPQLLFYSGLSYLTTVAGAYMPDLSESLRSLVRASFFVTPIIWPAERVEGRPLEFVVDYNPLAYLVGAYRDVVLNGQVPHLSGLLYFSLLAIILWLAGLLLFIRVKQHFADLI